MDDRGRLWDLVVIGGGTAGLIGARTAAGLGASVLLVERHRLGGDCLWTGCVPSKALLAVASRAADARRSSRMGLDIDVRGVDYAAVRQHVRRAVAAIEPTDSAPALEQLGVAVGSGSARFTGPAGLELDGRPVRFRQVLLATGSAPAVPPVPGLADAVAAGLAVTSDTVWDLEALPGRLAVLGGGTVGCELGQAFARLGSQVVLVEAAASLLPTEDPDASRLVTNALAADGVDVRTGVAVASVSTSVSTEPGGRLVLDDGREVGFDVLLVATGRVPGTSGQGLEAAGVDLDRRGFVLVDAALRTTNPRIWAAGDLTGHPQLTHVAGVHAAVAASNAVLGLRRSAPTQALPRVTFTDPEVAAVGVPAGAAGPGSRLRVLTEEHHDVDRAIAEGRTEGFTRLVVDARHRVVGATVVGPRAGESLAELALAVRRGLTTSDLSGTVHAYPTYGDGVWRAAIVDGRRRLAAPVAAWAIRLLGGLRRRVLDRGGRHD